jgi:hypothetical protein
MKERTRFRPAVVELEARLALSHGPANYSVLTGNDQGKPFVLRRDKPTPIVTLVNTAFNQFGQQYGEARGVYYGAVSDQSATSADQMAFRQYTIQQVRLLAQQLANSFLQTPESTVRGHHLPPPLDVLGKRIDGTATSATANGNPFQTGTLGNALINAIPPASSSTTTIALDTGAQENAIAAAQVAMINSVNILKNGEFGYNTSQHK